MNKIFCIFLLSLCCIWVTAENNGQVLSKDFCYRDITPQQQAEIDSAVREISAGLNSFYNQLSKCNPYKITDKNGERLIEIYGIKNDVCQVYIEEQDCYFPDEKYKEYAKNSKKMIKNSAKGNKAAFEYQSKVEELHKQYCKSNQPSDLF